ncbi:hypothetical protein GCM10017044_21440 [Kordiimonas sediminis]|uniref:DUF2336 domain-containing protein n=1 Tax=Kordiimonas sediminis TaxID=1735581 RepID=A0A919AWA1_9PROT|nr:DUF2336 domain-containing protein [Kordiimonas sediminis]GHF26241.1 hypothetical protein GCM10017044_21440 [Kordiimonas sediminis]
MSNDQALTSSDVARLLQDPSGENRAAAAAKVAMTFSGNDLSPSARKIAEDIFNVMVRDAEVRVRKALSENLKDNPSVPHDIATVLARDVDEVALPVIEFSTVLTDGDLVELVQTRGVDVQVAIAKRETVSSDVADVIAEKGEEAAVATLVGNEGAKIAEGTMNKVLDKYSESDLVKEPLAHRGELPLNIAERLVTLVSEQLQQHIMTHHNVSASTATDLLMTSREKATVSLLSGTENTTTLNQLIEQLYTNKRLTPSLVVRALCMGDTGFFEAALAKLADIPVLNVYKLITKGGEMGLAKLFEKAGIPENYIKVSRVALDVVEETQSAAGDNREVFRQLMIERVLTKMEDTVDADSLDYLLSKLVKVDK